jgi:hypothetical protein
VRARCGSGVSDDGAERARQVVIGGDEHLTTGYQQASPAPQAPLAWPENARFDRFCRPAGVLGFPAYRRQEVNSVAGQREAYELLLIEEADAWFEYLETTRAQSALRYREVEPWAWARLSQRLRAIKTRRAKLKPATEAA